MGSREEKEDAGSDANDGNDMGRSENFRNVREIGEDSPEGDRRESQGKARVIPKWEADGNPSWETFPSRIPTGKSEH
jgi:hypothetical protein